jgi:lipopolysaccharide export system protein LptA
MMRLRHSFLLICTLYAICANAQRTAIADTGFVPGKLIEVIRADRENIQKKDSTTFFSLAGKAAVKQETTLFYADSIVLNQKENFLEAFGNVHINDADTIHTYAQYLKYLGRERRAYLKKSVKLTDGKGVLTTEELEYDTQLRIGTYLKGAKLVNGKTTLVSREGYYYGDTKDVYFKQQVVLTDPEFKMYTDTLLYNTNTEIATFVSPSRIVNGKRTIKTREGFYNLRTKKAEFGRRPFVDDSTYTFTADQMAFDDSTGLGHFKGNAVYRGKDSTQGFDIIANDIKTNNKKNSFLATQKPILLVKQERDSIWIKADTLYSSRLSELTSSRKVPSIRDSSTPFIKLPPPNKDKKTPEDSTDKFFEAYYNVKIFSDSLQASCDSLFYSLKDSIFRLYKSPITWAQDNQITGDTMLLFTKNKKPERLYVYENALAISKAGGDYFNQLKGNTINGIFKDGRMDFLRSKGNSESIYYGTDDRNAFIGVNRATADIIDVFFNPEKESSKPQRVVFRSNLQGTTFPMGQVNHAEMRLRGFQWLDSKRPKSKLEILTD